MGGGRDITREFQMDITCADCLGNVEAEAKRLRLKNCFDSHILFDDFLTRRGCVCVQNLK